MVRSSIEAVLADKGYEVVTAADGDRGIRAFRDSHPDLVITDLIMPEQEGIATICQIRRERPDAKIIAISGGARRLPQIDVLDMALKLGADDALAKPFDPEYLIWRIRDLLPNQTM